MSARDRVAANRAAREEVERELIVEQEVRLARATRISRREAQMFCFGAVCTNAGTMLDSVVVSEAVSEAIRKYEGMGRREVIVMHGEDG